MTKTASTTYVPDWRLGSSWRDVLIAVVLALGAMTMSYNGAKRIPDWLIKGELYYDVWFDADSPRAVMHTTDREADPRDRSIMHPLFSLLAYPPVKAARVLLRVSPLTAVRLVMAFGAGLWLALMFGVLRLMGCRRFDAALFSVLSMVSAAAMFWFVVPESWIPSSITLLLAWGIAIWGQHRKLPVRWYLLASIITLSMTLTNWMLGLMIVAARVAWRRAVWISFAALGVVGLLCGLELFLFPTFKIVFPEYAHEYLFQVESGGPLCVAASFFFHTMIMPLFRVVSGWDHPGVLRMTVQQMPPGSATLWGAAGIWLWAALVGLGVWAVRQVTQHRALFLLVGLFLLLQLDLHLIYGGQETFLFSLHWLPCLIMLAALTTLTRRRPVALFLAAALIVCAGVNNRRQFKNAVQFVQHRNAVHGRF